MGVGVWLTYYWTHFQGLWAPDAMRYAGIAEKLVDGKGFLDCQVWPRQLLYNPQPPFYANRIPPLHPAIISLLFMAFGVHESMVALASGIFFVLSVPLVALLARELFGNEVALLSGVILLLDRTVLQYSISGLTEVTFGFFLILSVFLLVKGHPGFTGVAFAVAYLTRPGAVVFLFPLVAYVALSRKAWADVATFLAGFLVFVSPYLIWRYVRFGDPFLEVDASLLLVNTSIFPGATIVRSLEPVSIIGQVLAHPGAVLLKTIGGLQGYYNSFFRLTNPYLLALFVVALLRFGNDKRFGGPVRKTCVLVFALFAVDGIVSAATSPEEGLRFFVPLLPFVAIFASALLVSLLREQRVTQSVFAAACLLVAVFVTWPTFYYDYHRGDKVTYPYNSAWATFGNVLRTKTADNAIVISDIPNELCWYGNRQVLDLPLSLEDVERRTTVDAVFLTSLGHSGPDTGMWDAVYATKQVPGYYLEGEYEANGVDGWLFKKRRG